MVSRWHPLSLNRQQARCTPLGCNVPKATTKVGGEPATSLLSLPSSQTSAGACSTIIFLLPIEDIQGLRKLTTEIIRLRDVGKRTRWGPTRVDLIDLSKLILTDEQLLAMGSKKAEIATAILKALPSTQGESPTQDQPVRKRVRFDDEEAFIETQRKLFRARKDAVQPQVSAPNPWARYMSASSHHKPDKWLSWPCPLLSDRRQSFLAGNQQLLRDLRAQAKDTDSWATTVSGSSTLLHIRGKELPSFLAELADEDVPFPESASPLDAVNAYRIALLDRAAEVKLELRRNGLAVPGALDTSRSTLQQTPVTSSSISITKPYQVHSPTVPQSLSSVAAATFSGITTRSVAPTNLPAHIEDCCHIVASYDRRKADLMGCLGIQVKRPIPATAIQIIARRMAPAGNILEQADQLFPGTSTEAAEQRKVVSACMDEIFEKANIVASERISRGSALDRTTREREGKALSQRERAESMQRESIALARIVVLSRLIGRGAEALRKLQMGMQVPQLAKDLMVMSGLDLASATSTAKSVLKSSISQQQFSKAENKRNKAKRAAIAAVSRADTSNNQRKAQGNTRGGGRGRGRGKGRGRGRGKRRKRKRKSHGRRKCFRCGSKDHMVSDCPKSSSDSES